MAASEGKIVVKLVLDTTEFYEALDQVKAALENLSQVTARSVRSEAISRESGGRGRYNPVTGLHEWYADNSAEHVAEQIANHHETPSRIAHRGTL